MEPLMRHSESMIQQAVCRHLEVRGILDVVWFHVPNGGKRSVREAKRFKAEGVKPGVPDMLFFKNGQFGTVVYALELKANKGRLTDAQIEMTKRMEDVGIRCKTAFGLDEALKILEDWELLKNS